MTDESHAGTSPTRTPAERPRLKREDATARLSPWSLLLGGAVLAALLLGQWVWLVAILGLALLITVHEFGHFIAAKSFGMRVEKFYVGFPPAALRRTWGETEYGIGIIPLGGFCKISGMTPEEPAGDGVVDELIADAGDGKLDRTFTVGELDEALTELQGRIDSATAEDGTGDERDLPEWRRLQGVLEECRAGLLAPDGTGDRVYYKKAIWKRNVTIAAGPLMNFLAAAVILVLFIGIQGVPKASLTLDEVVKGDAGGQGRPRGRRHARRRRRRQRGRAGTRRRRTSAPASGRRSSSPTTPNERRGRANGRSHARREPAAPRAAATSGVRAGVVKTDPARSRR